MSEASNTAENELLHKAWDRLPAAERDDLAMKARLNAMSRREVIERYRPDIWRKVKLLTDDEFLYGEGQDWSTGGLT